MFVLSTLYISTELENFRLSSSNRMNTVFVKISTMTHISHLYNLCYITYSFDFALIFQNPSNPSKLIFGVDTGYIHTMTFKKPVSQLFETPFKNDEGVQKIFWSVSI